MTAFTLMPPSYRKYILHSHSNPTTREPVTTVSQRKRFELTQSSNMHDACVVAKSCT